MLDGPVERRSANAVWELTRGNAQFLRELVRYGRDHGLLEHSDGLWRWGGAIDGGTRLADLVDLRLGDLDAAQRRVLELVAAGAPLELEVLDDDERLAIEALEALELVELRRHGRRGVLHVAHPLHGEVVCAGIPAVRWQGLLQRLADAVEGAGGRRRTDLPRLAAFRLEAGDRRDPALFEQAAYLSLAAYDTAAAERFAQAATEAGGGFTARLALGRALAGEARAEEAEELLSSIQRAAVSDAERVALAIALARNRFWGLGRAAEAEDGLRAAEAGIADRGLRDELVAQRIRIASASGRPQEVLAVARPLLDDPGTREQARLQAALAAVEALIGAGHLDEAIALADRWLPVAHRRFATMPLLELVPIIELVLASERAIALRFAGRLEEATQGSEALYHRALAEQRSAQNGAVEASSLGYIWLARGRPQTALRLFRESAGLLRRADAVGMLGWALAGIAQAAAQAGDAAAADAARAEMAHRPLRHKGFEPELGIASAWAAAARGELSRAAPLALGAAALARDRGQSAFEVRALHEAARLGGAREAAARLAALAGEVDGGLADAAAEHAAGLVAGDGPRLLAAAERFAAMDALLVAAEAAHAAGAAYAAAGRAASARSAAARGRTWLARCEGARPVTLLAPEAADDLTAREREIALLAAGGLSSRTIAERLVVSVRTVDNHLQRAYRKLGVTRREELAGVLQDAAE
jgi:DNA-binding CsgD family transcriptional regulator